MLLPPKFDRFFFFLFSAKLTRIEGSLFTLLPTSEAAILYIDPEERCPSPPHIQPPLQDSAILTNCEEIEMQNM